MTDTTQTLWSVDGVSLQTLAWNIVTLGEDRMAPPTLRGDDVVVPYRPGSMWLPKVLADRTITLGMWVTGADADGNIPQTRDARRQFDHNWRMLRKLLFTPRRQFTLTKQFWVPEEDAIAAGVDIEEMVSSYGYVLMSASAKGTYAGGLLPFMTGGTRAAFTVDIKLNDPLFYSDEHTVNFSLELALGTSGHTKTIQVLGDDRTYKAMLTYTGPLVGAKLTNDTCGVWLRYATGVSDGITASVDVYEFRAMHDLQGTAYKSSGYVDHGGDKLWFYLEPGNNLLKLTAVSGTGTVSLTYQPGWY